MDLLVTISILLGFAVFFRIGFSHSYKLKSIKVIRSWLAPAIVIPAGMWAILIFCAGNMSTVDSQYNFFNMDPENYKNIAAGLGCAMPLLMFINVITLDPQMKALWKIDYRWKYLVMNIPFLICSLYVAIKYGPYQFLAIPGMQILLILLAVWNNYTRFGFGGGARRNMYSTIDLSGAGISDSQRQVISQIMPGFGQQQQMQQDASEIEWKNLTSQILCYTFLALYYIMLLSAAIVFTSTYCSVMPTM